MLMPGDSGKRHACADAATTLVCFAVVVAASCGPVIKVSLIEAALTRLEAMRTAAGAQPRPSEGSKDRDPGADPALSVCTHSDWDRSVRPSLDLPRSAIGDMGASGLQGCSARGTGEARRAADDWPARPGVVNPNSRPHAPPAGGPQASV